MISKMDNDISNYNLFIEHMNRVWSLCCWFSIDVNYKVKR